MIKGYTLILDSSFYHSDKLKVMSITIKLLVRNHCVTKMTDEHTAKTLLELFYVTVRHSASLLGQ